jgi:hypothetical protein
MPATRATVLWAALLAIGLLWGQQSAHAAHQHANTVVTSQATAPGPADHEPAVVDASADVAAEAQSWAVPSAAHVTPGHIAQGTSDIKSSSSSSSSVWLRVLLQRPSSSERDREAQEARKQHLSAGHVSLVMLMCLVAVGVLGFIGWRVVAWYQNLKRPGYVELQSMETYHRPRWMPGL